MLEEKLIYPRFSYQAKSPGKADSEFIRIDNSPDIEGYQAGDRWTIYAGAPGIGHTTYEVTKVDDEGVWGFVVEDSVQLIGPSEVI